MTDLADGVRRPSAPLPSPDTAPHPAERTPSTRPSEFEHALHRLGREIEHGEALVGGALRRGYQTMDAGTLIALQAGIYRYSEAVDLIVKLVDRTTGSVRTVLESGR